MSSIEEAFDTSVPPQGSNTKTSLLPTSKPSGIGFFGSSYNPADAMKTPAQIGVKVGDSMDDVVKAVKGVGFYTDQIGFGAPSTGLTQGMPLQPLGVNYFIKTGVICSNGAEMWEYMKGITEGDALGQGAKKAMEEMGLPPLKGLAPGIIEDVKHGLNPEPLMNALFGSGYPQCRKVKRMVGDSYGRIRDPDTNEPWISDVDKVIREGGTYMQERWVQDVDNRNNPINLTKDNWRNTAKTYNPDGTPLQTSNFQGYMTKPGTMVVIGILCVLALGFVKKR